MNILITSPLYPPDIADPATHVKELAYRLARDNQVTLATYGSLPEQVEGVRIVKTSKKKPLLLRLVAFTVLLAFNVRRIDLIYSENGASVELPVLIVAKLFRKPLLLHIGDIKAYQVAQKNKTHRTIHRFVEKEAKAVMEHRTLPKPEILPFGESVALEVEKYEQEWERHLGEIEYHKQKHVKKA